WHWMVPRRVRAPGATGAIDPMSRAGPPVRGENVGGGGGGGLGTPRGALLAFTAAGRRALTFRSFPAVGVLGKARTLRPHHAEPLAGGRLHHHPALQGSDHSGAVLFQPAHLRGNVVGLDVDVHAARMVD